MTTKKNHKTIAIIHYTSPPIIAGVELMIKEHIECFKDDGFKVKLISGEGKRYRQDINFVKIPEINSRHPFYSKLSKELEKGECPKEFEEFSDKIYKKLKKSLKNINICIVHQALTMHFNLALTAALVRLTKDLKEKVKFIHWTHDSTFLDENYTVKFDKFKNKYPWNLLTQKHPNIKYVVISNTRQKQLSKLFSCSIKSLIFIPNGIDIGKFFNLSKYIQSLIGDYDLFNQDLIAVLPNRILPRKNIEQSINIIYELKKLGIKIKFILTGIYDYQNPTSADYYQKIQKLVKKNNLKKDVIFLNQYKPQNGKQINLRNLKVSELYLLADFLLFPSKLEGFGRQIIESGITKTPVVCSDIGPFKETAQKDGLYFKIGEAPKKTAKNIIKFLEDIPTSRAYRRQIKNYCLTNIYENKIKAILNK